MIPLARSNALGELMNIFFIRTPEETVPGKSRRENWSNLLEDGAPVNKRLVRDAIQRDSIFGILAPLNLVQINFDSIFQFKINDVTKNRLDKFWLNHVEIQFPQGNSVTLRNHHCMFLRGDLAPRNIKGASGNNIPTHGIEITDIDDPRFHLSIGRAKNNDYVRYFTYKRVDNKIVWKVTKKYAMSNFNRKIRVLAKVSNIKMKMWMGKEGKEDRIFTSGVYEEIYALEETKSDD